MLIPFFLNFDIQIILELKDSFKNFIHASLKLLKGFFWDILDIKQDAIGLTVIFLYNSDPKGFLSHSVNKN